MTEKPENRERAKLAIAKQIALIEGRSWHALSAASRIGYLTHAENIIATVERLQSDFRWS